VRAATDFEYKYRFWILIGLYWIGFAFYPLDRTDLVSVAARGIAKGPPQALASLFYGLIAVPILIGAWLRSWAAASSRAPRHLAEAGTCLIMLGFGVTLNRPGFLFMVIALAILMYRLMQRNAPASYATGWREALLREGYLWIIAAAWPVFAMTGREPVLYSVLGAAVLVRGVSQLFVRRKGRGKEDGYATADSGAWEFRRLR
jgi:hypothetical protein